MKKVFAVTTSLLIIIGIVYGIKMYIKKEESFDKANVYLEDPDAYMEKLDEKYQQEFESHDKTEDRPDEYYENLKKELIKMENITVPDEDFISIMSVLDRFPESFEGKKIELIGFIFREREFLETQVVIARRGDPCCVDEHDGVYGLLSTTTIASELLDKQWVKVSGTLSTTKYSAIEVPYLQIREVIKIKPLKQPYVYEPK